MWVQIRTIQVILSNEMYVATVNYDDFKKQKTAQSLKIILCKQDLISPRINIKKY